MPSLTGSKLPKKRMGIALPAAFAARVAADPTVSTRSGPVARRLRASSGRRLTLFSAQRVSITRFCPST
jgi:hypothetical protein